MVLVLLHLAAVLGFLTTTTFAQSEILWGSVIYTYHGEKTPSITSGPYNLSPLGATQMLQAGSFIRSRNIDPPTNTSSQLGGTAPINGISVQAIDNSQLTALSTDDEFISGSAMAFFQGLYPPRGFPIIDEQDILANGTNLGFPLDGYQYPNVETVSELDFNYIWIAGNIGCTNWANAEVAQLESTAYITQSNGYQAFYDSLAPTVFWDYEPDTINYGNAWVLYEYALYQYNHNQSNPISSANLSQLYNLASQQQFELNTPNTFGTIPSISGQTLASAVLQQFQQVITSSGVADKLTVLFGSFEPMLAFFALSGLNSGPSQNLFNMLPQHGSVMSFELFSNGNTSDAFPASNELFVRFLFRNGTSDTDPIIEYPLFGRGNSEDTMSWMDFVQGMGDFSLNDVVDWCSGCNSATTLFCADIDAEISNSTTCSPATSDGKKGVSPAVGGVIGATVTLAVLLLAALILGLCGFRLNYHPRHGGGSNVEGGGVGVLKRSSTGTAGGFKGPEKLASDTDLTLKSGAGASVVRHERVGSWELNDNKKAGSSDKDIESGRMERVVSTADYGRSSEDHVDPFGDPVKPLDQV